MEEKIGSEFHDVVEIAARDEALLSDEVESLDGRPPSSSLRGSPRMRRANRSAIELSCRAARDNSMRRVGMTVEVVRLQHAERGVDPAEVGVALVERRGDRQGIAFRRLPRF